MYTVRALAGNYVMSLNRKSPTWTGQLELAKKMDKLEAQQVAKTIQEYWGVQVTVEPVFSLSSLKPKQDYTGFVFPSEGKAFSSGQGNFEYTL